MKRVLVVLAAVALSLVTSVPAFAEEDESSHYLALGDSVAFGYTPRAVTPPANYLNAANFVGYPEMVARELELKDLNASCPGEATGGFISKLSSNDNGCLTYYRLNNLPLHVAYTSSQLDFAVTFLHRHRHSTKLVTINLGANDLFHQQTLCKTNVNPPLCFANALPGVLFAMQANLGHIFAALRATGYEGKIVALTYYATVYDAAGIRLTTVLNQPMINAAQPFNVRIASGFDAFQPFAAAHGGSSCAAGLLIALGGGLCDVHPTPFGHAVLAAAVIHALGEDD
jgi:lysophospholipase L1-like esterase